jgi:hypothetical protein
MGQLLLTLLTLEEHAPEDPLTPPLTNESEAHQSLPMLALETILCGLADRPKNIRAFEKADGVKEVVRLLRSKLVSKPLRWVTSV